jgi:hypothetical protein
LCAYGAPPTRRELPLAIVTADGRQQAIARDAGLPAFATVAEAQARAWERDDAPVPPRRLRPPRRFVPNSLARFFPKRRPWARLLAAALTLTTLLTVGSLAFIAIHEAKITLSASSQRIATIVPVRLDTNIPRVDLKTRTIPAVRLDVVVEGSASTPATGQKSVPSSKARGSVTFFNLLTTSYVVPSNTVVRTTATNAPVRFVTLNDVEVPPAGRASVGDRGHRAWPGGQRQPRSDQPRGGRAIVGRNRHQRSAHQRRQQRHPAGGDRGRLSPVAR